MKVAVIGAGRLGTAVAVLLVRAGHRLVGVSGRGETRGRVSSHLPDVPVVEPAEAAAAAELVVIGTPDDAIEPTVAALAAAAALMPGAWVMHLSGSLGLEALRPAREVGARGPRDASAADVPGRRSRLGGPPRMLDRGDRRRRGGLSTRRAARRRPRRACRSGWRTSTAPLYHAAAVFASNYLVTVSAIAEALFGGGGRARSHRRRWLRCSGHRSTTSSSSGPAQALTGPAVRGDAGTIQRNLEALARHAAAAVPPYVALCQGDAAISPSEPGGSRPSGAPRSRTCSAAWS